ncbi:hypothetical protein GE21DRAFT_1059202 [Neurospora crassa]|nr:hypothetical protein GE21DRAFT_1059202 [Neurospora crassa]
MMIMSTSSPLSTRHPSTSPTPTPPTPAQPQTPKPSYHISICARHAMRAVHPKSATETMTTQPSSKGLPPVDRHPFSLSVRRPPTSRLPTCHSHFTASTDWMQQCRLGHSRSGRTILSSSAFKPGREQHNFQEPLALLGGRFSEHAEVYARTGDTASLRVPLVLEPNQNGAACGPSLSMSAFGSSFDETFFTCRYSFG